MNVNIDKEWLEKKYTQEQLSKQQTDTFAGMSKKI